MEEWWGEEEEEVEVEEGCSKPKVQKSIWHRQVLCSMWRRVGGCFGGWVDECWGGTTGCHGMGEMSTEGKRVRDQRGGTGEVVELVWEESKGEI